MDSRADATFVIPVWNRADLLGKLLQTIERQTVQPARVIAVDNASTDDAAAVARRWGADVERFANNRGFAQAVNHGIQMAQTEWIAILNTDVELDDSWLENLLTHARDSGADYASGKILIANDPSRIDGAWDLLARSGCAWRAGSGARADAPEFSRPRHVALISATAALYNKRVFEKAGFFEPLYESYLEDVDLSLRCAIAGLRGFYDPTALATHVGSASTGRWSARSTYLIARNQSLLVRRLFPVQLRRRWRFQIATGQLLWGLLSMRHGQAAEWVRGKRDANRLTVKPVYADGENLAAVIARMERELFDLQSSAGQELYWRAYRALAGSGL